LPPSVNSTAVSNDGDDDVNDDDDDDNNNNNTTNTSDNALHDLTITKMIVARFVGTESFLFQCSNGHTK
jgi:hypothetical protein